MKEYEFEMPKIAMDTIKIPDLPDKPEVKVEGPYFTKRKERNRRQVRFWANAELHREFSEAVAKEGLFIQDTFEVLMKWFIAESAQNRVKVK